MAFIKPRSQVQILPSVHEVTSEAYGWICTPEYAQAYEARPEPKSADFERGQILPSVHEVTSEAYGWICTPEYAGSTSDL